MIAAKVLDLYQIEKEAKPSIREVRKRLSKTEPLLMMKCSSENLVKCYDVYQNKSLVVMMMEYCKDGTL